MTVSEATRELVALAHRVIQREPGLLDDVRAAVAQVTTAREAKKAQELREYMARPVIYTADRIAQIEAKIAEFEKHIANIKVTVSIYGERDALSIQANSLIPECTRIIAKYRAELEHASRDPKTRFDVSVWERNRAKPSTRKTNEPPRRP